MHILVSCFPIIAFLVARCPRLLLDGMKGTRALFCCWSFVMQQHIVPPIPISTSWSLHRQVLNETRWKLTMTADWMDTGGQ
jgi:hypothetical protein